MPAGAARRIRACKLLYNFVEKRIVCAPGRARQACFTIPKFQGLNYTYYLLFFLFNSWLPAAIGQVVLPGPFADSMIFQRGKPVRIWGKAAPGEKITVHFINKTAKTRAGKDGKWLLELPAQQAGGPYTMQLSASNTITLKDILVGDVFFCSGQSNMVHQVNIHDVTYANEIATAHYPQIRQFTVPTLTALAGPDADLPAGTWKAAVGENLRPFSAVAYFFAKKLFEKYHVPIGIINASVGGSPIEAWTSEEGLQQFPGIIKIVTANKDSAFLKGLNRSKNGSSEGQVQQDKGLSGPLPWYAVDFVPGNWRIINIPGYWEDQGARNLDGVVWYRRKIDIPVTMTGKPATVFLGRIVDADVLYINGKQAGFTTYQYPQRRYRIPAGLLKPGRNLFVIRVTNNSGKGGFVPGKPYCVFAGGDTVDLKGYWQYKVGEVYDRREAESDRGGINAQNLPTALYNAMVAPFTRYGIKGFLWYQGESNAGAPQQYEALQRSLIADWRNKWKDPSLPFLYVQLPNYMEVTYLPEESNWALVREAQLKTLSVPNTAMAVAIDLGEWNDIHPDNKKDVGERLALAAQKIVYGENIVYTGPLFRSAAIENNKIVISFTGTGSGLITNDGEAPGAIAIAGADKKFVWAQAKIEAGKLVVWSDRIGQPLYVRYAWADNPDNANLYNKEGLPASPFRTDE